MLRRIAMRRSVSRAEVEVDAIEREVGGIGGKSALDPAAWKAALATMRRIHRRPSAPTGPRKWRRADLYEARVGRRAERVD